MNFNYAGTTQFAGEATTSVNATDGYASGTLTGVQLSADGSVLAQYSNGQKQSVGKIVLAAFPAEGALVPVSDTSWTTSVDSGAPLFFTPGSGMAGELTTGSTASPAALPRSTRRSPPPRPPASTPPA